MKVRFSLLASSLVLLTSLVAPASQAASDRVNLVRYNNVPTQTVTPGETLKFFIWNVAKYDDVKASEAVASYSRLADFVFIEESMMGGKYVGYYNSLSNLNWYSALSWQKDDGTYTGVSTGTHYTVNQSFGIRSNAREPFLHTPKMIVVTELPIAGRTETLWAVNVHGINFVGAEDYLSQINQLEAALKTHKGPIVLAGDFNMWSLSRALILRAMSQRVGLEYIWLHDDYRTGTRFDHVFTRGMTTVNTEYLNGQEGSDHQPMWAEFSVTP